MDLVLFKQSLADNIYEEIYHYYYDYYDNNTELQEGISMNENQSTMTTYQRDSTLMAKDIENPEVTTNKENFSDTCTNGKFLRVYVMNHHLERFTLWAFPQCYG